MFFRLCFDLVYRGFRFGELFGLGLVALLVGVYCWFSGVAVLGFL